MPDIQFTCPSCSQSLAVDEAGAGMVLQCPACGNDVTVPQSPSLTQPSIRVVCTMPLCCRQFSVPADMAGKKVKCPHCERDVQVPQECPSCEKSFAADAVFCSNCGMNLKTGGNVASAGVAESRPKLPATVSSKLPPQP